VTDSAAQEAAPFERMRAASLAEPIVVGLSGLCASGLRLSSASLFGVRALTGQSRGTREMAASLPVGVRGERPSPRIVRARRIAVSVCGGSRSFAGDVPRKHTRRHRSRLTLGAVFCRRSRELQSSSFTRPFAGFVVQSSPNAAAPVRCVGHRPWSR
jgi:hypothetical protein